MRSARLTPTMGVMPAKPDPRVHQYLRLVIDEHERERSELAHELHEQVAQALAAVLLGIDSLAPADGPENYASRIAAVRDQVAKTLDYCRNLAVALRPPLLDQLGLVPALERLAERAGAEQISLDPSLSGPSVGPALRTGVYRSVEEALATVTGKCILAVSVDSAVRDVRISVRPLDADTTTGELVTLAARLELLGGTIAARHGELVVHIPIEPETGGVIAAFPQPGRVGIPDGERRALP